MFGEETQAGELGTLKDKEVGHLRGETWRRNRDRGRSPRR